MQKTPDLLSQAIRRIKWGLDPILDRCGYTLARKHQGFSFFSQMLHERMRTPKEIVFVQIGANDGTTSDPLYPLIKKSPRQFRGLVVEPLKDKFELLTRTYADIDSITPVNLAVHNTEREMVMHRVRPDLEKTLPPWTRGLGSFNPEHHKLSRLKQSYMVTEKVICRTFEELLAEHRLSQVELLITDTEGYDFEILRNIDFAKYRPTYIHFEHGLEDGVMSWEEYKDLVRYIARYGYNVSHEIQDATAFLPEALASQC